MKSDHGNETDQSGAPQQATHKIVGGGFSGLYTAWRLLEKGHHVQLYEAARLGGMIQTRQTAWGQVETAANGFLANRPLYHLAQQLGLQLITPKKSAKARYILGPWGFRRWPLSFWQSLGLIFNFLKAKLTNSIRPRGDETVFAWAERCLGPVAADRLVRPGVQGVYACSADELSAQLVLNRFFNKKKKSQPAPPMKGLVSLAGGMGQLLGQLSQKLYQHPRLQIITQRVSADELQLWAQDSAVQSIWIALDAPRAADLTTVAAPELSKLLSQVKGIPVVSATVFLTDADDLQGFGFLNHPRAQAASDVLGVLFNNLIFEGRSPHRSETWILKGQGAKTLVNATDAQIQDYILRERQRMFPHSQAKALHFELQRWAWGLPHYSLQLAKIQGEFRKDWSKIRLVGNYVNGIGLTQIADDIQERLQ